MSLMFMALNAAAIRPCGVRAFKASQAARNSALAVYALLREP
jgi:hypothetical protein